MGGPSPVCATAATLPTQQAYLPTTPYSQRLQLTKFISRLYTAQVAEARSNELKVQTLGAEVEGLRAQLKNVEDEGHAKQHHLHREAVRLSEQSKHQTTALAHAEERVADLASQTRTLISERDALNARAQELEDQVAGLVAGGDEKVREKVLGVQRKLSSLTAEAATLRSENGSLLDRAKTKDERAEAAETQLGDLTAEQDKLRARLQEKEREVAGLTHRTSNLEAKVSH